MGTFLPNPFKNDTLSSDQWCPEMKICRVELPNEEVSQGLLGRVTSLRPSLANAQHNMR